MIKQLKNFSQFGLLAPMSGLNVLMIFFLHWFTISTIGPGEKTDAFFASLTIPQLILSICSGPITFVLTPIFSNLPKVIFYKTIWSVLQLIVPVFSFLFLLLLLSVNIWVFYAFPGFSEQGIHLTIGLVEIQLIAIVFSSTNAVLWSVYQAKNQFVKIEILALISNLCSVLFLVAFITYLNIYAAVLAILIKGILQTIFLIIPLMEYYQLPDFRSDFFKSFWKRIKPLLFGSIYYKSEVLLDRFFVSMTFSGGLTILYFAQQLYGAGNQVLNKAIITPSIPKMSNLAENKDWLAYSNFFRKRLITISLLSITIAFLIFFVGEYLLQLLVGFKNFNEDSIKTLWELMICLLGFWIAGSIGSLLTSGFYSMGNTLTPTKVGTVGYTIGIILKIVGFLYGGIFGIAIATSIYYCSNAFVLFYFLDKKMKFKCQESKKLDYKN